LSAVYVNSTVPEDEPMRAWLGALAAIALLSTTAGHAATRLTSADGKVTREPLAGAGAKGEGTWKLDKEGFCTTWKGQKPNCYNVITNGQNKWSIMRASSLLAVWSK
jgi:hypothetical protein